MSTSAPKIYIDHISVEANKRGERRYTGEPVPFRVVLFGVSEHGSRRRWRVTRTVMHPRSKPVWAANNSRTGQQLTPGERCTGKWFDSANQTESPTTTGTLRVATSAGSRVVTQNPGGKFWK